MRDQSWWQAIQCLHFHASHPTKSRIGKKILDSSQWEEINLICYLLVGKQSLWLFKDQLQARHKKMEAIFFTDKSPSQPICKGLFRRDSDFPSLSEGQTQRTTGKHTLGLLLCHNTAPRRLLKHCPSQRMHLPASAQGEERNCHQKTTWWLFPNWRHKRWVSIHLLSEARCKTPSTAHTQVFLSRPT